jgi:hypothetical protein
MKKAASHAAPSFRKHELKKKSNIPYKLVIIVGVCLLSLCPTAHLYSQGIVGGSTIPVDTGCKVFSYRNFVLGIVGLKRSCTSRNMDTCFDAIGIFRHCSRKDTLMNLLAEDFIIYW